jgi:uncharacterized protein YggU (UPF0235/DUF167 family)
MTVWSTVHSSLSYPFRSSLEPRRKALFLDPYPKDVSMKISVRVVPNAKRFSLKKEEGGFRAYVPEKAEGNKANAALLKNLGKLLKMKVGLLSGAKARDKVLEIEASEEEVLDALGNACAAKGA